MFNSLFQKKSQNLPVYLQMYPPPGMKKLDIRSTWHFSSGLCTPPPNEKVGYQVNMTFWFWMMYPPPPRMKKLDLRSTWHFGSGWCTPPQNEKVGYQVNMTFWFWMMYTPEWKSWISGQHDILVLDDVPPPQNEKVGYQVNMTFWFWMMYSPPIQLLMIGWACQWTQKQSTTHLQPKKVLIFGLHSTSSDRPGWSMDLNSICHPSPAKKVKCSFLDYV